MYTSFINLVNLTNLYFIDIPTVKDVLNTIIPSQPEYWQVRSYH